MSAPHLRYPSSPPGLNVDDRSCHCGFSSIALLTPSQNGDSIQTDFQALQIRFRPILRELGIGIVRMKIPSVRKLNPRCNGLTEFHTHVSRECYAPTVLLIANRLLAPAIVHRHCSPCFHESTLADTAPMPERISRSDGFLFPVTSGSAPCSRR